MKQFAFCLAGLLFSFSSAVTAETKIYHWVDEQGKNHFSDTAAPDQSVEELSISEQNLLFNNSNQEQKQTQVQKQGNELSQEVEQETQQPIIYQASISSPQDDSAVRSNDRTLEIHMMWRKRFIITCFFINSLNKWGIQIWLCTNNGVFSRWRVLLRLFFSNHSCWRSSVTSCSRWFRISCCWHWWNNRNWHRSSWWWNCNIVNWFLRHSCNFSGISNEMAMPVIKSQQFRLLLLFSQLIHSINCFLRHGQRSELVPGDLASSAQV